MNSIINSSAVIIKPKPEFLQWLASDSVFSSLPTKDKIFLETQTLWLMRANATIISMPFMQSNDDKTADEFVDSHAAQILEAEFDRWSIPAAARPEEVNLALLKSWFDITYHARIFALGL